MSFRAVVHEVVQSGLRQITHPVQGYIPEGGIDAREHTATIRIPNPHAGIHPAKGEEPKYLEFHNIPLPYQDAGQLTATAAQSDGVDRGVVVGFRGANLHHPYIISLIAPLHAVKEREEKKVEDRQPAIAARAQTPGAAAVAGPPPPPASPPVAATTQSEPAEAARAAAAQTRAESRPSRPAEFGRVFGPVNPSA